MDHPIPNPDGGVLAFWLEKRMMLLAARWYYYCVAPAADCGVESLRQHTEFSLWLQLSRSHINDVLFESRCENSSNVWYIVVVIVFVGVFVNATTRREHFVNEIFT